jgi:hypothetical protein
VWKALVYKSRSCKTGIRILLWIGGAYWHDRSRNQCDSAERLYFGCHSLRDTLQAGAF